MTDWLTNRQMGGNVNSMVPRLSKNMWQNDKHEKKTLFYLRSFILDSNIVNHWMHQIDIGILILIRVYSNQMYTSIRKLTHGSNEKLWFNTVVTIHWHILSGLWTKQISKYTCTCNIPGLSCIIVCYTYIIKHLPQILNLAVNQRLMSSLELIFSSYGFAVLGYQMCEALNLNCNYHYLYECLHKFLQILLDTVISYDSNIIDVIFHIGPGRGSNLRLPYQSQRHSRRADMGWRINE